MCVQEKRASGLVVHAGRLTAMQRGSGLDFFTKARVWAGVVVLLAGLCAIVGSAVEWVTVTKAPPRPPPGVDFQQRPFATDESSEPFTGLEVREGWVSAVGGAVLMAAGLLLISRNRGGGLAVLAAMPIGAMAISSYRSLGSEASDLLDRSGTVGDVDPGLGLVLISAAAVVGLISGVVGLAATPRSEPGEEPL
jgi:hypothetical protein